MNLNIVAKFIGFNEQFDMIKTQTSNIQFKIDLFKRETYYRINVILNKQNSIHKHILRIRILY